MQKGLYLYPYFKLMTRAIRRIAIPDLPADHIRGQKKARINIGFIVKISFIGLMAQVFFIGMLSATTVRSQNLDEVKIDLNLQQATMSESFRILENKSGVKFCFYEETLLKQVKKINLNSKQISVQEVLNILLRNTGLRYRQTASCVIVETKPIPQQTGKLAGKISDEKGETLPGVSIKVVETGGGMQSTVDGTYTMALPPGTYTLEVSYISYQTQRITGIQIKPGIVTKLDISMKPAANALKEVVVTSGFQKASVAGLYAKQKNAAGMTDGISAAQISRTPDNNVGAVLKRISGLNVVDNRYVVVRGLSDRYNQAQIDGVTQASTEMNQRNFAFDAIPAELVSSVVVNKTATPDMSAEFAGGQVIVNTLDIPVQNFTQYQIGTGYNSNTIGKDFLQAGKRGNAAFFGFIDNTHKLPFGLKSFSIGNTVIIPDFVVGQSKTFNPDGFKMYSHGFEPNQNYRFTLGRAYPLKNGLNFGFVGGATLRNSQEISDYISTRRGLAPLNIDLENVRQTGNVYKYNSTISGLLNFGLQGKGFKLSFRNMYSHVFKNDYTTYTSADPNQLTPGQLIPENRQKFNLQSPESTTVLQHKLDGEHTLGESGIKLTWNGSYTNISQTIDDRRKFQSTGSGSINGVEQYQSYAVQNPYANDGNPDYRLYTDTREKDYNWGTNLSRSFDFLQDKTLLKIGYSGFYKKRSLANNTVEVYNNSHSTLFIGPYEYSLSPELLGIGPDQAFYNVPASSGEQFNGTARNNSVYAMLDQSFFKKLRLVYGVRYESYKIANTQLKSKDYDVNRDDNNDYLPSANLTYSLTENMNFRASYATTIVRPDFRETSIFGIYDPILDAIIQGNNVKSTKINNSDIRYEWYPTPGEIISVSAFYKKFAQPIELVFMQDAAVDIYQFQNQKSATNYGLEMELRKSLSFIADKTWLQNLSVFGNGTVIRSKVNALVYSGPKKEIVTESNQKRPLFGQSPWIVNAGIAYTKDQYGLNVVYNKSGYRTSTLNNAPDQVEYEMGRDLVDLQVFTRLFKQKGELKLNIANLLNAKTTFYKNTGGYDGDYGSGFTNKEGTSDKYKKEEGDFITYQSKSGTNFSIAFTYKF